jgi:hypothetical protein
MTFKSKVLKWIFGPRENEITKDWIKLHSEQLPVHNGLKQRKPNFALDYAKRKVQ